MSKKEESTEILKGTTRAVYRHLLKSRQPVGVREVQKALKLSSPSVAIYHLDKLEDAGILRKENGSYVVEKVLLENCVKISHFLVPRYLFYAIVVILGLIIDLSLFRPPLLTSTYFFSTILIAICASAFSYEAIKAWRRQEL